MVREFRLEDIDEVMQIWLITNITAHDFIERSYWEQNYRPVSEMMPKATIYVYEQNGKIRAFVGLMDNYIAGIFVSSEYQSKGMGKALLHYCKETHRTLSLNVYKKNRRAVHFYLREGFSITDEKMDETTGELEYEMKWKKITPPTETGAV